MLTNVRAKARKAIELLYEHTCTIIEYQEVTDDRTGITRHEEIVVAKDMPCKLSYSSVVNAEQSESVATVSQAIKLFVAPEITIKPNSKIIVNDVTYVASGKPTIYKTHQEITLILEEKA